MATYEEIKCDLKPILVYRHNCRIAGMKLDKLKRMITVVTGELRKERFERIRRSCD